MYDLQAIHTQLQDRASPLFQAEQVLVRHLYRRLACLEGSGDPLFSLWRRELEFSYGDLDRLLSRNAKIQPQALWDLYGFGNEPGGSLIRLLESLQTFYSILIKLIARDMVGGALGSPLSALEEFQDILSGQFFIRSGIENYCYEDWYTWIVKYWDQDLSADCRLLAACLEQADQTASAEDYLKRFRSDSLRRIYETVFPREIRHALGEYYTPDWLAGQAVEHALETSGGIRPALRILDPTCGSGTFLTYALRRMRSCVGGYLPGQVVGFDINALAVLTAKTNYLAAWLDYLPGCRSLVLPVYHCDVLNWPAIQEETLVIDTNFDLICQLPLSLCQKAVHSGTCFRAETFLDMVEDHKACRNLRDRLSAHDPFNRRIIANILLNRMAGFFEGQADMTVGNPPWVNWEYLPPAYRAKSLHLWQDYGLCSAKGPRLSFAKEDISTLITCLVIDRFLAPSGCLSFVLRQALFQSAQNGAGFRRFHLDRGNLDFRILRVDDLSPMRPFPGVGARSALVLIRRDEHHTFPVPYYSWTRKPHFLHALRQPDATASSVMAFVDQRPMAAFPAHREDPTSIWVSAPEPVLSSLDALLGENPYRARTGVFTGGANAVYWMEILGGNRDCVQVRNLTDRAKRRVETVTAALETTFLYPLVRGSDLSQWQVRPECYLLCPHTPQTKIRPVEETLLRETAPKTAAYLHSFQTQLNDRRGFAGWERAIQEQYFYALLRVGPYTFSRYKVAWRYIASSFITAVIAPVQDPCLGQRLPIPNEKVMYVGTDCREEAYYLCGILSSSPVRCCVKCYMNPTSISAHVLDKLNIPRYDPIQPLHRTIGALCLQGHQTQDPARRNGVQAELDQAVGALYGISEDSMSLIRQTLEGRR